MSKLEELILKYCPDGVRYAKIKEICSSIFAGGTPSTSHSEYYDGEIPWLRSGEIDFNEIKKAERNITDLGLRNSSAKWIKANSVLMAMTGATVAKVATNTFDTTANQSVCAMEVDNPKVNYKYLYYILELNYHKIRSSAQGALTSLNLAMIKEISIPLPPLPVQEEIVRILDSMVDLQNNIEAELKERKKQYEHYRNKLLSFTDGIWLPFKKIFFLKNGYTPSKKNISYWENGTLPWFRMDDIRMNGHVLSDSLLHIAPSALKGNGLFPANSIILATSATIGEHALITVPSLANQRFTYVIPRQEYKDLLNIKFIFYYMFVVDEFCKSHTNRSGFESVDMTALKTMTFPLPPLPVQEEIVRILDSMTALQANLEAELAERRRQYEYYRNKILSFE